MPVGRVVLAMVCAMVLVTVSEPEQRPGQETTAARAQPPGSAARLFCARRLAHAPAGVLPARSGQDSATTSRGLPAGLPARSSPRHSGCQCPCQPSDPGRHPGRDAGRPASRGPRLRPGWLLPVRCFASRSSGSTLSVRSCDAPCAIRCPSRPAGRASNSGQGRRRSGRFGYRSAYLAPGSTAAWARPRRSRCRPKPDAPRRVRAQRRSRTRSRATYSPEPWRALFVVPHQHLWSGQAMTADFETRMRGTPVSKLAPTVPTVTRARAVPARAFTR